MRANAHADFFHNLDSQPAFFQALDNIQSRLGEKSSDQRTTPAYPYPSSDNENPEMADSAISSRGSWEDTTVNRAAIPKPSIVTHSTYFYKDLSLFVCSLGPTQPTQRKSRWEEIRAEHARSMATRSSWDELRQNAGRTKSENTGSNQARRSEDTGVDRLAEQQKFDALIEAERQRAMRG